MPPRAQASQLWPPMLSPIPCRARATCPKPRPLRRTAVVRIASLAGLSARALCRPPVGKEIMFCNLAFVVGYAALLVLFTAISVPAAQYGTAEEAKAMLDRAVSAVKEDKAKALE